MKYLGFGVFRNVNLSFHPHDQLPDHWTIWKVEDEIERV